MRGVCELMLGGGGWGRKGLRIGGYGQKFSSDCVFQQKFQRICGSNKSEGFTGFGQK